MLVAYPYPPGPAVVAAPVAVPRGVLALLELGACAQKRRVRHLGARGRGDRPAYRHAVEAVDYRGEVGLSRGDAELRDVRYPELVRRVRPEVVLPALVPQQVVNANGKPANYTNSSCRLNQCMSAVHTNVN